MANHLIAKARGSGDLPDLAFAAQKFMRWDFGTLALQVCNKLRFSSDLREAMKQVNGFRNHFAHECWPVYFGNLRSERGTLIIVEECALYERQFQRAAEIVIAGTGVEVDHYVDFVESSAHDEAAFVE